MENQNILGIYLSSHNAYVVCTEANGTNAKVISCFSVSVEHEQPGAADWSRLASLIAQQCAKRNLVFSEVAVALDCSAFMQHEVHSNFDSSKQIAQTIRFDTEEALATDVSDVAISFEMISSGKQGSDLNVFTATKNLLSEIINALAASNLDAASIEPDVICLSRFIKTKLNQNNEQNSESLFAVMSPRNCYFTSPFRKRKFDRTLPISSGQNKTDLLKIQVPVTTALLGVDGKISRLEILDSSGSVEIQQLQEKLPITVEDLKPALGEIAPPSQTSEISDIAEFAIALGAAEGLTDKYHTTTNFRNDFMPYLGRKRRLEKTLKFISISAIVIFIALGLSLHIQLIQKNRPVKQLNRKLAEDYSDVMLGKKMSDNTSQAIRSLESELRRIKSVKSGQFGASGDSSVPAQLALVLSAFNNNDIAKQTNLNIDRISITGRNIIISGDTSNRANTLKLLTEIKKLMDVQQEQLGSKDNRDTFNITAGIKSQTRSQ
ncbi:MAG: hypothetical protein WCZ89_05595 [Phycisphaerae bacterium]